MRRIRYPDYQVWARTWAIVTLYNAGAGIHDIARLLDLSDTTVWYRLRLSGVRLRVEVAPTSLLKRQPYPGLHRKTGSVDIVLGRKFCSGCGRWRLLCDFPPDTRKSKKRRGKPISRCEACGNIGRRYYQRHATAEQVENRREYQRIYKEAQRRAAGVPVSTHRRRRVTDRPEYIFLDPAPLLAEIERTCVDGNITRQRIDNETDEPLTFGDLAALAGIHERALYRLRYGESQAIRIDNADKLAVALGLTLELIYQGGGEVPWPR